MQTAAPLAHPAQTELASTGGTAAQSVPDSVAAAAEAFIAAAAPSAGSCGALAQPQSEQQEAAIQGEEDAGPDQSQPVVHSKGSGKGSKGKGKATGPPASPSQGGGSTPAGGGPPTTTKGATSPGTPKGVRATKGGPPPPKAPPGGKGKSTKGSDEQDANLRQPVVTPSRPMKALWWNRYVYGRHLNEGSSVWDRTKDFDLEIPKDVFEVRFGQACQSNPERAVERRKAKSDVPTELRIVHDPNKIVGKEGALRGGFPPAESVAQALLELDTLVLDPHRLGVVNAHFCPQPHEVAQLEECRKENPNVPFAPAERYMWHVSRVPAFRARVDCLSFVNNYEERAATYAAALTEFQSIQDSILSSKALPQLLAHILWVGNYLNGGTKRGRADGFDLETLTKLDSVKDNQSQNGSRDVRHFIFELFFMGKLPGGMQVDRQDEAYDTGVCLMEDLTPLFRCVNRTLMRDKEGMKKVVKTVKVVLEDVEGDVKELAQLFAERYESLLECLKYSDDPADTMKLVMAEQFAEARPRIARLEAQAQKCRESYAKVMAYFNHSGMKSSDFVLLWDDFFIPPDLIVNKPETLQKEVIVPSFCKPRVAPSVDALMVLWDICTPDEICQAAANRRKRPPRRRFRQSSLTDHSQVVAARCARHWRKRVSLSGSRPEA